MILVIVAAVMTMVMVECVNYHERVNHNWMVMLWMAMWWMVMLWGSDVRCL